MPPSIAIRQERANPAVGYLLAVVATLVAVFVAGVAERWLRLEELSLVFMLAVLLVAARTRTGPAVLTALLCFLAYNFFFIEPRYTLYVNARHGVATVVAFLAAALLAGRLASRLAMQVQALCAAHRDASARQELGQRLAVAADEADISAAAADVFGKYMDALVWIRLGERELSGSDVEPPASPRADLPATIAGAQPVIEHGWWFLPLPAARGPLGMIGLKLPAHAANPDASQRELAHGMAGDIAQALLRIRLVADLQTERVAGETERLRSALLSSVSHDLRSPLASIIGSASSLEHFGERMDAADRGELLDTIRIEGERLDRYIQNLLDMTRLGHGGLALNRDWIGVDELLGAAVARIQRFVPDVRIELQVAPGLAPLWVHPALLEQALFNVIENAAKFSPPGEAVHVAAQDLPDDGPGSGPGQALRIDIEDRGPGIPEAERARIFDMFYSVERGDRGRNGTGLGLTIAQGMVGAHGGSVEALTGADGRGTRIRITLPRLSPPASEHQSPA